MLKVTIPGGDFFDEEKNLFVTVPKTTLQLEHSLLSISRWESKWKRSFFNDGPKTLEEKRSYIREMTITSNVNNYIYKVIPKKTMDQIDAYCNLQMTATTVHIRDTKPKKKEIVTSELIYYWMIQFGIPFECEKWHMSRLWMLIQVCNIKNNPKKETKAEAIARTRSLNAKRRGRR